MWPFLTLNVALTAIGGVLTGALAVVGVRYRSEPGAPWFAATMGLCTAWIGAAIAELAVDGRAALLAAETVATACSLTVPACWFAFVVAYLGYERLSSRRRLASLFAPQAVGIVAMLAWPHTGLYFSTPRTATISSGQTVIEATPGPLAWALLGYVSLLIVAGLALIGHVLVERGDLFSGQAVWLFAGPLAPFAVGILQAFEVLGLGGTPVMPATFALLGLAYGYGLFSHRLLDLSPAARRIGTTDALSVLEEGVVVVDSDGDLVAANDSACSRFGWERSAVLGTALAEVDPDLPAACGSDEPVEFTRDGAAVEVTCSSAADRRGRAVADVLVIRDVTERRNRRQRLEVLNRVLRHNLRNQVMLIDARARQLVDRNEGEDAALARDILDETDDLIEIADKARAAGDTVASAAESPERVDVGNLASRVAGDVGDRCDPSVSVRVEGDLAVRTHERTLELVLENLVENAAVHGTPDEPDGGDRRHAQAADAGTASRAANDERAADATVSRPGDTTASVDRAPVRVRARRVADAVVIEVEDDGPGIPAEELRVIERGTETPLDHGTGLGLWLVSWGAAHIGADLSFETDDGTTARLRLPVDRSE